MTRTLPLQSAVSKSTSGMAFDRVSCDTATKTQRKCSRLINLRIPGIGERSFYQPWAGLPTTGSLL